MKNSGNDVRHALKMFRKNPGFTAAAVAACVLKGSHLVRVHDVKAMKPVVEVADEILRASTE